MDNAIARRNVVLGLMADTGKISKTQADNAKRTTLTLEDTFLKKMDIVILTSLMRWLMKQLIAMA